MPIWQAVAESDVTFATVFQNDGRFTIPDTRPAHTARIERVIDNGTLAIWKPGQARQGDSTIISPQTGLVSYPIFDSQGVVVRTLFQPSLTYGSKITIQSSMTPACGDWNVYKLTYDLACLTKNGPWFCDVWASRPGQMPVGS